MLPTPPPLANARRPLAPGIAWAHFMETFSPRQNANYAFAVDVYTQLEAAGGIAPDLRNESACDEWFATLTSDLKALLKTLETAS